MRRSPTRSQAALVAAALDERRPACETLPRRGPSGGNVTSVSRPDYDRLLIGSPLRRRRVCIVICVALMAALSLAMLIHLSLLASMRPDVASVFYRALALSSVLAAAPLVVLWFRRERETPWLFAAAFLWGGFIATALALPFNTAFFALVDLWGARSVAKRRVGTAGDPRGVGGGSRAYGEPGRVPGDRRRSHAPDAPHRPDTTTSIGGANKCTA